VVQHGTSSRHWSLPLRELCITQWQSQLRLKVSHALTPTGLQSIAPSASVTHCA
jgi:hypothetical protein